MCLLVIFILIRIYRKRSVGACQKWIYNFHLTFELPSENSAPTLARYAQRGAPGRIGTGPESEEEVVEESVLLAPHV